MLLTISDFLNTEPPWNHSPLYPMNKKNLAKFVHNYVVEKSEEVLATNVSYFYVIQNIPQGCGNPPPPSIVIGLRC